VAAPSGRRLYSNAKAITITGVDTPWSYNAECNAPPTRLRDALWVAITNHFSPLGYWLSAIGYFEEAGASSDEIQQLQTGSVGVVQHQRRGSDDPGICTERRTFYRWQRFGGHGGLRDFLNQHLNKTISQ